MTYSKRILSSVYSSPLFILGQVLSASFQALQLKNSSQQVIELSSLILSCILITASITQVGIPARIYYELTNQSGGIDEHSTNDIIRLLSTLLIIQGSLSIIASASVLIFCDFIKVDLSIVVISSSILYFATIPLNQLCAGIFYARSKSHSVSMLLLLDPLFRFLFLIAVLYASRHLSVAIIMLIYGISSVLQLVSACYFDSFIRHIFLSSLKSITAFCPASQLKDVNSCWPYGLQQMMTNFSEQTPIIFVANNWSTNLSAYFIILTRIVSILVVLPAHFLKLSLFSAPLPLARRATTFSYYVSTPRRLFFLMIAIVAMTIFVGTFLATQFPDYTLLVPVWVSSLTVAIVVTLRLWNMIIESYLLRMALPLQSAIAKITSAGISVLIFYILCINIPAMSLRLVSSYLPLFFLLVLSAMPSLAYKKLTLSAAP